MEIPRSDRAKARDNEIIQIRKFLEDPDKISHPNDKEFKQFIQSATKFFVNKNQLWRKDHHGKHKLVIPNVRRLDLICQAHDDLGHKGIFTIRNRLLEHFWWPNLDQDVKWYIQTCHECQLRLLHKLIIPLTIPIPGGLFRKVYINTMLMPKAKGYRYIIHARCSLTSYPECKMVKHENFKTIAAFLYELVCRWGAIKILITDNAPQYLQAAELLAEKFHIKHIKISPYNSRAQGPIERQHYDVWEAIMKAAEGDESKWPDVAPAVFWAEHVTIQKSTGYSPYYLAHGVEPLLPFDLAEGTYLAPDINGSMLTEDLIALQAKMLLKRPQDLARV